MRKRKKKTENDSEAWMLPYSDMLTLLLALFIVMFAAAKVDDHKFQQISSEFGSLMALVPENSPQHNSAAGGTNAIELSDPVITERYQASSTTTPKSKAAAKKQESAVRGSLAQQSQANQLKKIAKDLNQTAATFNLGKNTKATIKADGLHLTLDSNILFNSGSAKITSSSAAALQQLSSQLEQLQENEVVIAGYTDDVPQSSAQYPSNWELSSARAVAVMHFFVGQGALTEKKVALQAYGENQPQATNATPEGRAKNRRVEIIIKKEHVK